MQTLNLICNKCNSQFDKEDKKPRMKECGHSFCESCIVHILENPQVQFICPVDKNEYTGERGIQNLNKFPINNSLIFIIDKFKKTQESLREQKKNQEKDSISHVEVESTSEIISKEDRDHFKNLMDYRISMNTQNLINQCPDLLLESQYSDSVVIKDKNNNDTTIISNSQNYNSIMNEQKRDLCITHQKINELVCIDCSQNICSKCAIFGKHQQHNIKEIEDFQKEFQNVKQEIIQNINDIKNLKQDIENDKIFEEINNSGLKSMQETQNKIKEEIEEFFEQILEAMTEKKVEITENMNKIFKSLKTQYETKMSEKSKSNVNQEIDSYLEKNQQIIDNIQKNDVLDLNKDVSQEQFKKFGQIQEIQKDIKNNFEQYQQNTQKNKNILQNQIEVLKNDLGHIKFNFKSQIVTQIKESCNIVIDLQKRVTRTQTNYQKSNSSILQLPTLQLQTNFSFGGDENTNKNNKSFTQTQENIIKSPMTARASLNNNNISMNKSKQPIYQQQKISQTPRVSVQNKNSIVPNKNSLQTPVQQKRIHSKTIMSGSSIQDFKITVNQKNISQTQQKQSKLKVINSKMSTQNITPRGSNKNSNLQSKNISNNNQLNPIMSQQNLKNIQVSPVTSQNNSYLSSSKKTFKTPRNINSDFNKALSKGRNSVASECEDLNGSFVSSISTNNILNNIQSKDSRDSSFMNGDQQQFQNSNQKQSITKIRTKSKNPEVYKILEDLKMNNVIKTVDIYNKNLQDFELLQIIEFMNGYDNQIESIKFMKNKISDTGLFHLISYLIKNEDHNIHSVNLTSNQISPASLDRILEVYKQTGEKINKNFKTLILQQNKNFAHKDKLKVKEIQQKYGLNIQI